MGKRISPKKLEHAENPDPAAPSSPSGFTFSKGILAVILLLGLSAMGGWYWMQSIQVKEVRFSGYNFTTVDELTPMVQVPADTHPDSIDFMALIERVESVPYVHWATVNVNATGVLEIDIGERQPVALLIDGSTKTYVDSEGVKLPVRAGKAVNVPILYGFSAQPLSDTLQSEGFRHTVAFLQALRNQTFADATLSEVAWTPDQGIVAMSHENGVKLVFGKEGFGERLNHWKAFYSQVIRQKGINRMRSIDFRFEGQIVTREHDPAS
ncbi:MAG: cell division protein FtsQ/DivIB [Bacteroidota bacterium]